MLLNGTVLRVRGWDWGSPLSPSELLVGLQDSGPPITLRTLWTPTEFLRRATGLQQLSNKGMAGPRYEIQTRS
jgi:hypothetical protein